MDWILKPLEEIIHDVFRYRLAEELDTTTSGVKEDSTDGAFLQIRIACSIRKNKPGVMHCWLNAQWSPLFHSGLQKL